VRQEINYEAQAAIELEALVEEDVKEAYEFAVEEAIDSAPLIRAVVSDVKSGVPSGVIAAKFHNGMAAMIRDVCVRLREESDLNEVVLSGGVFQNVALLERVLPLLRVSGFTVYTHHLVPPNDGGLSLGQAMIAAVKARR
jgi:hydrogenase maturation protein HypF